MENIIKLKKFKEITDIDVDRPLTIFINDKLVFENTIDNIKHSFTRERWSEILEMEVQSRNDYFEFDVFRLKENYMEDRIED